MSPRRRPPARFQGVDANGNAVPELRPVSPLPRPADPPVRPGAYGVDVHVPTTPYLAPLPSEVDAESAPQQYLHSADPLAFLAAQTRVSAPGGGRSERPEPRRRFQRPPAPELRRASVAPPGYRG